MGYLGLFEVGEHKTASENMFVNTLFFRASLNINSLCFQCLWCNPRRNSGAEKEAANTTHGPRDEHVRLLGVLCRGVAFTGHSWWIWPSGTDVDQTPWPARSLSCSPEASWALTPPAEGLGPRATDLLPFAFRIVAIAKMTSG